MPDLMIQTCDGREVYLTPRSIEQLGSELRGDIVKSGHPGYDQARAVWNAMIDRRPSLVARCTNATDVLQAVRFARNNELLLAVRGGGHNIAGNAICDDGLLIDLSGMRSVRVDPQRRSARVDPGATLGDFDRAAQEFGLATPLGINSTTGVAGLTLGGGFGWLSRRFGLTIDNLLSADVVTANGELVRASASQNPDLFWAIRGGGGNFGVVTSFEFKLHPVGPDVLSGLVVHPLEDAPAVLRYYRDFVASAPDEFACWFVMRKAPPLPFLAPEWHGREILGLAMCYSGDIAEGERVMAPLRAQGRPVADVVAPHPYVAWQTILDPLLTSGERNYWKSHDFIELSDGLIDVFLQYAQRLPDPQSEIAFAQLGGAVGRVADDATAYTHRNANFVLNVHGRWSDPGKDAKCIAWARDLFNAAGPYATGGVYVNFLTGEEGDRVREAYGSNFDRLIELKNRYDPKNLFRVNQNIRAKAPASRADGARASDTREQQPRA
jgi:FAD/FMN-containing dehydrogenase